MIKINTILNNKSWSVYIKNPNKFIQKNVNNLNKKFKKYKKNILFCTLLLSGDDEIKKLNKKFRKKNKSTDVLSFPYNNLNTLRKLKKKDIYLGDIILNYYKIKKKSFKENFNKLWIHGFLHLVGHKHKKNNDYYKMNKLEKLIFSKIQKK